MIHGCVHKGVLLIFDLSRLNPAHALVIYFHISSSTILLSTPRPPNWSLQAFWLKVCRHFPCAFMSRLRTLPAVITSWPSVRVNTPQCSLLFCQDIGKKTELERMKCVWFPVNPVKLKGGKNFSLTGRLRWGRN